MEADADGQASRVSYPAPPGGYGSAPPSARFGPMPLEEQAVADGKPRRSLKPFIIIGIILAMCSTLIVVGVVVVVGVVGVRRQVRQEDVSKAGETRNK